MVRLTYGTIRYTVHLNCRPLRWMGKLGLTLGSHVFLAARAGEVRAEVLAHEMKHVIQWEAFGLLRFVWRYGRDLVRYGYGLQHPMEQEAYDFAVSRVEAFRAHAAVLNGRL